MSEIGALHHIGIVVEDLTAAVAFFRDTLRLPVVDEIDLPGGGRAAFLGHDGAQVELLELGDPEARAARLGDASARLDHVAFSVDDVATVAETLAGRGVAMTTPKPIAPAGREVMFTDPATSAGVVVQLFGPSPG